MNITVIVSKALNKENWKKGVNYLNKYGVKGFIRKLKHLSPDTDYNKWFLEQRVSDKLILEQANYKFEYEPEISITIPLYNTKREFLKDIMDSIVGQSYQKWELCLADGSKTDDVEKYLREHYLSDSRIKYKRLNKNLGIAGNTNTALNMASGEFIMLADHDDVLEKDALFEIVSLLNKNRKLDIVYTDEDLTNKNGLSYDKGCFYISVPGGIKGMEPVASHWQQHDALGASLIEGLRAHGAKINGNGSMAIDLTQTSYSTVPSVDVELGNACSDHSDATLENLADGLVQGVEGYF